MLVRERWEVELELPFKAELEHARLLPPARKSPEPLDDVALQAALHRLAEVELDRTVLVDNPLYRLLGMDISAQGWNTVWSTSDFLSFALTNDLLENELLDVIAAGKRPEDLLLRQQYLPSIASAVDFESRTCVGGVAGLVAIAREEGDYLLLVQKRSSRVLNLAGRLSVIPRAFHQPVSETAKDLSLTRTLVRELEEELLGRDDLELLEDDRRVDPLHPARFSEAMRALQEPGACHMECTGFAINGTNGNYEVSALIVIDDPTWWTRFGHQVEANWESTGLQRYSSLDHDGLTALAHDPHWSDGGLFDFLQGLRRLATMESKRVAIPHIELKL